MKRSKKKKKLEKEVKVTPNVQLARFVRDKMRTMDDHMNRKMQEIPEYPQIIKDIKEFDKTSNNVSDKEYAKTMKKHSNRMVKAFKKHFTKKDIKIIKKEIYKNFTPEELKALKQYQKDDTYWTNGL